MRAMIVAAGLGTRLQPLTDWLPKPALPVRGLPLIAYQLALLAHHGVHEVVVNVHHLADRLEAAARRHCPPGLSLRFSRERELLDTGGGIRRVAAFLRESDPCLIVGGDMLLDVDLGQLVRWHRSRADAVTLLLREDPRVATFGSIGVDREGLVRRIGSRFRFGQGGRLESRPTRSEAKPSEGGPPHGQRGRLESRPTRSERKPSGAQRGEAERRSDGLASEGGPLHEDDPAAEVRAGVYAWANVVSARALDTLPEREVFSHFDGWLAPRLAAGSNDVGGAFLPCRWEPVGTLDEYLAVNRNAPELSYIDADARAKEAGVRFEHGCVIGAGASVGAGASLHRVVVWEGERVPEGFEAHDGVFAGGRFHPAMPSAPPLTGPDAS